MAGKTEVTATPGGREIVITRVISAPRAKVWEAYYERLEELLG
jgi:uncharacterized protein YndB with AHSA1/START domain